MTDLPPPPSERGVQMNKHEEWNKTFDDWWDSDKPDRTENPYRHDSAAYWAYAGWVSGRDAMLQEVLSIVNGRAIIELEHHFEVK